MKIFDIEHEELKKLFIYDEKTGVFYRKYKNCLKRAGTITRYGYRQININGGKWYEHRLAYFYVYKLWPDVEIDHINQNKLDNRIENLRLATRKQNAKNNILQKNSKTGICGVNFKKQTGRYYAHITINKKHISLGYFDSLEEAAKARKEANKKYEFFENHGRKINEVR